MDRMIDEPDEVAEDFVGRVFLARPDLLAATDHPRAMRRAGPAEPRAGIVTDGGLGHEPAFVGLAGPLSGTLSNAMAESLAGAPSLDRADGLAARLEPSA